MIKFGLKLRKRSVKNNFDNVKITEFTVYSDLVIQEGKTRLEQVGLEDKEVYKEVPCKCSKCESDKIVGMNVLGAGEDILFWMCDICENLFLTKDVAETEILLEMSSQYWTNPNDWGAIDEELN
jgi:hypothetical protein